MVSERGKESVLVLRPQSRGFKNAQMEIAIVVRSNLGWWHANRWRGGKGMIIACLAAWSRKSSLGHPPRHRGCTARPPSWHRNQAIAHLQMKSTSLLLVGPEVYPSST